MPAARSLWRASGERAHGDSVSTSAATEPFRRAAGRQPARALLLGRLLGWGSVPGQRAGRWSACRAQRGAPHAPVEDGALRGNQVLDGKAVGDAHEQGAAGQAGAAAGGGGGMVIASSRRSCMQASQPFALSPDQHELLACKSETTPREEHACNVEHARHGCPAAEGNSEERGGWWCWVGWGSLEPVFGRRTGRNYEEGARVLEAL